MDLAQRVAAFNQRLTAVQNTDRSSEDRRTDLSNALNALSFAWLTLSDLFRSGDLQPRPEFDSVLEQIVDDLENIVESLTDLLRDATRRHREAVARLIHIPHNHAAAHPLRIFFRSFLVGLRRKQIAYGIAVLSLVGAASNHIIARAYRRRPREHVDAATARQRETILNEEKARLELASAEGEVSNRNENPLLASSWLSGFSWPRNGDLPLGAVANRWFAETSRSWQNRTPTDAITQTQLDEVVTNLTRHHNDALQRLQVDIGEMRNHIAGLQAQLAQAARQRREDARIIGHLQRSLEGVTTNVRELRATNERLIAENRRLRRALQEAGNVTAALPQLEAEAARLNTENAELRRNIGRLEEDNRVRIQQAAKAQAELSQLRDRGPRRSSSNNRSYYPPQASLPDGHRRRRRDSSPTTSQDSSRRSGSSVRDGYHSDSSTAVESTASRESRQPSSPSSSQHSTTRASEFGLAAYELHEMPSDGPEVAEREPRLLRTTDVEAEKRQAQVSWSSWSRFTTKMRGFSRDRGRGSTMVR